MITKALIFIATVSVHVAGSTLEATDGQDIAIPFGTVKLERVEEVKVIFAGEDQKKSLIAIYCSHVYVVPSCTPVKTHGVSLQVEERNVSLILQHVNISRSGHYKAQAFCGKDVDEATATLVVNKASFPSSRAPTHTSTLKPPDSSEHQGLLTAAVIVIIIIIIIITLVFCFFCKWRRILCFKKRDLESNSSDCLAVSMNG
ncbi:uncharacterized protein LOC125270701 [Megalobrama amblycephala]|uniref:uncharacterized protein LOC125270701 n=1 Tax=Megalobrama amblycephala TaxID=75352 RepID=UPI002013E49C|nr:uncharacterized protein LOC125270701 [Megalobrama amblycephala]XP_048050538.1 uncharacterized protein LOC125270701 [Megalobrama amblycephala]